jgi:nitrogen fixation protein NifU and related proteins
MTNVNSYSKKVLEHFKNPHNYGKMKKPSAIGEVGNIICGDVMFIYIKVEKELIKDISFETYGCAAAIATSSAVTDLVKGKTIDEALKITKDNIIKTLDGLPSIKIHCSLLAVDALHEAIFNYLQDAGKEIPESLRTTHKKNKKEREFVEEKHSTWVKAEKKLKK